MFGFYGPTEWALFGRMRKHDRFGLEHSNFYAKQRNVLVGYEMNFKVLKT